MKVACQLVAVKLLCAICVVPEEDNISGQMAYER